MTLSLVLRPLAMLGLTMLVPQGTPATGDAPEDTLFVRFREGSGHTVRGPLVSSSSGYRAYVTVTAEMRRLEGWPTCVNTASLFVASPGAGSFSMVFQKEPTPERSGNGLRLVDWWGPDGRTLAAVSLWWQEDSDVGGHGILIYRAETKRVVEPDLDALFSRSLRRECSLRLDDIPGFTESGELVVKVGNWKDSYDPESDKPCLSSEEEHALWAIDVRANSARRLPSGYVPKRKETRQVK